jgi:hypothetical protein
MLPPALVCQQSAHWNQRWSYCSYYETFSKNYGPKFDLSNSDTFHMDWSTLCVYELGTIKSLIGWCIQPLWCSQWCKRHWAHACTTDQTVHCCHQNMSKYRHDQSMTMTCQNGCSTLCKHPQSLQRRPGQTIQLNSLGIPRPQKGGRHLQYVGTEFCRFLVWFGQQSTFALRCDQEPSIFFFCLKLRKGHYQNHQRNIQRETQK